MELKIPNASFVEGLKLGGLDTLEPDKIVKLYNEAIKNDPSLDLLDPIELGKVTASTVKAMMKGQPQQLNTQLKSPMAGTQMAQRNPQNPEAEWVDQFDPKSVDTARKQYEDLYNQSVGHRNLTNYSAASTGNTGIMDQTRKSWDDIDKHRSASTEGLLEKKQTAATKGSALAKETQDRAKVAGEYEASQKKSGQTIEGTEIDLEVKRKMKDPNSPMSQLARASALRQWKAVSGEEADAATKAQFAKMNFLELGPIAEPNILKMWKDVSAGRTAEAGATIDESLTNTVTTGTPKSPMSVTQTPTPKAPAPAQAPREAGAGRGFVNPPINDADRKTLDDAIARSMQNPKVQAAKSATTENLTAPYGVSPTGKPWANIKGSEADIDAKAPKPQLTGEYGDRFKNFGTITGAGGRVTIPPDTRNVRGAESEAEEIAKASQRSKVFEANVAPDIKRIRETLNTVEPGKLTEAIAKWMPANNQQELVNLLNTANASYPGVLQSGVDAATASRIRDANGFNGGLIASMTGAQIVRMLNSIEEKAKIDKDIAVRTLKSRTEGAPPGTSNITAPTPSTKPDLVKMRRDKDGQWIAVPGNRVKEFESQGFIRK